jgi:hypothetical protein
MCGGFNGGFDTGFDGCWDDILQAQINQISDDLVSLTGTTFAILDQAMFKADAFEVGASCLSGQVLFLEGEPWGQGDVLKDLLSNNLTFSQV